MILYTRLSLLTLFCSPLLLTLVYAAEDTSSLDEQNELAQLMALLDEQTTIATKTRLNADYVPGMVTVLHSDKLEAAGARTVWEALARVPGIELSIEETGRKQIVVRGIGRTYASGNVKIMLNGVAMNSAQTAYANPVLNLPIEQVSRIEVIRGPGSAIHGEFAYTGVVNVITREGESRLYGRIGSDNLRQGGGHYSQRSADNRFSLDLNLAAWHWDGGDVTTGNDTLYLKTGCGPTGLDPCANYSNAPGPTNEAEEGHSLLLSSRYDDFTLQAQFLTDGFGDHFGINDYLPPDEKHIVTRNTQRNIKGQQRFHSAHGVDGEVFFDWQENREEKNDLFIGNIGTIDANCLNDPAVSCATDAAPFVVDSRYRERRLSAGGDLRKKAGEKHKLLLGYSIAWIKALDFDQRWGQQGGVMTPFSGTITEGMNRHINNITLQDEYRADDNLTITVGLRHDEYSDVGGSTTPRLGGVWRLSRTHILKAQYAEAFRPPTFYEIGGAAGDIIPSTNNTLELGYIHKGVGNEWRLSMFRTHIKDPIVFALNPISWEDSGYINADDARLHGAEVEWDYKLNRYFDIDSNLSYLQSRDDNTGEPLAGSSDWLANIDLNYHRGNDFLLNLHYRYVDDTYREPTDTRPGLAGYSTLDATLNLMDLWSEELTLRFGIKNLQDTDIRYPAPANTYPDDRPRAGRLWWSNLTYTF